MPEIRCPHDYRNYDLCVPGITSPSPRNPQTPKTLANRTLLALEAQISNPAVAGACDRFACAEIQWHVHAGIEVADKPAKRCSMHRVLSKTHYLVYNFDWVWEQWTLK